MKTSVDIPDDTLKELLAHTNASTKREAILHALDDFNRRQRLSALAERLYGSIPDFMSQEDLKKLRANRITTRSK